MNRREMLKTMAAAGLAAVTGVPSAGPATTTVLGDLSREEAGDFVFLKANTHCALNATGNVATLGGEPIVLVPGDLVMMFFDGNQWMASGLTVGEAEKVT